MEITHTWTAAAEARRAALSTVGSLGEFFAPMLGPQFMGGPEWPSRPGYQAVQLADGGTLLTTNGLSDAWEHQPQGVGLGLEIYVGSADVVTDVHGSWLLSAVQQLGNVCAGHGGVLGLLEALSAVTIELEADGFPEAFLLENGRVCVLLGTRGPLSAHHLPNGPVRYVCATLITPDEYAQVMAQGDARRVALAGEVPWKRP